MVLHKDKFFLPPQLRSLLELRQRVRAVIASVTRDTLPKFWEEVDYGLDACRVTSDARIESMLSVRITLISSLSTDIRVNIFLGRFCFMHYFESVLFLGD